MNHLKGRGVMSVINCSCRFAHKNRCSWGGGGGGTVFFWGRSGREWGVGGGGEGDNVRRRSISFAQSWTVHHVLRDRVSMFCVSDEHSRCRWHTKNARTRAYRQACTPSLFLSVCLCVCHTRARAHTHAHTHTYARKHKHTHVCTHTHTLMHAAHTHARTHRTTTTTTTSAHISTQKCTHRPTICAVIDILGNSSTKRSCCCGSRLATACCCVSKAPLSQGRVAPPSRLSFSMTA